VLAAYKGIKEKGDKEIGREYVDLKGKGQQ